MVKIFYTPLFYRNAAELFFKQAAGDVHTHDYSQILYLAPTPAKLKEAQKIFNCLQRDACYIPPETATIIQFCKKVHSAYGTKRVVQNRLVPLILSGLSGKGIGFSSVMADFISGLKQLCPNTEVDSIRHGITALFHELNISEAAAKAVGDGLELFGAYQMFIDRNGLIDEDDVVTVCPDYFSFMARPKTLILDGFYDPGPSELSVLKALIQHSDNALIAIPYDLQFKGLIAGYVSFLKENFEADEIELTEEKGNKKNIDSIVYCAYPGIEEEVEGLARNIKSLYISGKDRDLEKIIVTFPELNKYAAPVERIFNRYGIPCDITAKEPLGKTRPFLDLLCLLTAVAEEYPRLAFAQFLSSGHFSRIPDSLRRWVPSLSLQSGIVSGKAAWLNFVADGSETLDLSLMKERPEVEKDLLWVFKKLQALDEARGSASFNVYAGMIKKILHDFGFPGHAGDALSKNLLVAATDQLEQLSFLGSLHPAPVKLAEFTDALKHLLNTAYLETENVGVKVMSFSEACGLSPEYAYLGGLTDGDMPKRPDMDYLLPDSVKKKLGILHLDKYIEIQQFNFYTMIRSCKNLHLSYPVMDGDNMFLPSSFLYFGSEIKEKIPGIFSKEEYLIAQGLGMLSDHLPEITRQAMNVFNSGRTMRVTDIDAYRSCPRKFFIERILNLKPLRVKEYELEAATIGIIIHKIMERLVKEPMGNFGYLTERAGVIVEETLKDRKIDDYWKTIIRDTFIEMLPDIYAKEVEIRHDGYISTETEKPVSGEPVKGIKLRGKIDRLDRIDDAVQIIDYKTGTASLNCKQALEGNENLQLFLYAAIMKHQGYKIKRAGLYSLKDMAIKWCPPKRKGQGSRVREQEGIDDYIISSLQFLEDTVKNIRSGDFTARPLNAYNCYNCHENAFCPYIQQ